MNDLEYPLDEGLPPPDGAEKGAVDAVIELEVTDGGVTHLLTGDSKAWITGDGGVTWQEAPMPQTPLTPTSNTGRGFIQTIKARFTKPEPSTGFKAYGNHWLAVYSNNLEDREGEIFPAVAIDQYIERVKSGIVPKPELWLWHTPGTRIGETDIIERVGAFVVAAGTFDSTPQGQKAQAAFAKKRDDAMSHGFTFDPDKFDGRHYWSFNTFEISVLPRKAAANLYTSFEEIEAMAMTEETKAYLKAAGIDPDSLDTTLEKATESAKAAGLAYKDFTAIPAVEDTVSEKQLERAEKAFGVLVTDIAESLGDVAQAQETGAKALTTLKTHVDGELAKANKAISDLTALVSKLANERPRIASTDDENTIESAGLSKQIADALTDDESNYETVAGIRVRKMQR